MKKLSLATIGICTLLITANCVAGEKGTSKPNIIYILADDLGYGDVACYNPDSKLPTPRIDRLAKESMRFSDAHSCIACSPTRYEILTGRNAFRALEPMRVLMEYDPPLIAEGRLTVPQLLKKQNYLTACIGKWHLGWDWPRKDKLSDPDFTKPIDNGPTTRGFDEYFGTDVPNFAPFAFIENNRLTAQPTAQFPGKNRELFVFKGGAMVPGWKFEAIMPALENRVLDYLKQRASDKKPFFLYYTLTIPHEPLAPKKEFLGKSGINRVGDLILQTDAAVGLVLDALVKLGLDENTLLIFASDNGHGSGTDVEGLLEASHDPGKPFRGYKGSILEGGHRVPFMVRWPGKVKAGTVCNELISLNSLMATCADLLNVKIPFGAGEDSHSILPLLLGQKSEDSLQTVLVHASNPMIWAVRQGKWKLVKAKATPNAVKPKYPQAVSGLYNLEEDPAELNNLIEQYPGIAENLNKELKMIRFPGGFAPHKIQPSQNGLSMDKTKDQAIAEVMKYIRDAFPKTVKEEREDKKDIYGLPHPYNSPCIEEGFTQLFYWDTYFTNLGLLGIGMGQQAKNNVDNLMFLVKKTGKVPNANRASMANRSQIPLLASMIRDIFYQNNDTVWAKQAYTILKTEYAFWMAQRISPVGLNRSYNSASKEYLEGFYTYLEKNRFKGLAFKTKEEKISFSSNALSEAETWDFTPRFDRRAEDFCPVDQNSALLICTNVLAQLSSYLENGEESMWKEKSEKRKALINQYLWNENLGCYSDYDFVNNKKSDLFSAAAFWPLWAGAASQEQAEKIVGKMRRSLEFEHGLSTCEKKSWPYLYQWDYPNAWPPLQCIAIQSLDKYGYHEDARRIAEKYVSTIVDNFQKTRVLWEKYNALTGSTDVADEYKMPAMVGWTAGTFVFAVDYLSKSGHDSKPPARKKDTRK